MIHTGALQGTLTKVMRFCLLPPASKQLYIAALGVLDQWEEREKWVPQEEEEPKEKKASIYSR